MVGRFEKQEKPKFDAPPNYISPAVFSRGINEENISNAFNKVRSEWGCVVQSAEVKAMVQVNTSYVH